MYEVGSITVWSGSGDRRYCDDPILHLSIEEVLVEATRRALGCSLNSSVYKLHAQGMLETPLRRDNPIQVCIYLAVQIQTVPLSTNYPLFLH